MASSTARRRHRWLPPILAAVTLAHQPSATTTATTIDEALLTDLLTQYETHAPTECTVASSLDSNTTTTFTFIYPGLKSESEWNPDVEGFEENLFQAMMSHVDDTNGERSWEIRIGTGGNIYSATAHGMEIASPQKLGYAPWIDEVDQIVSVNKQLNGNPGADPNSNFGNACDAASDPYECNTPYYIHQAGAYTRESPYTDAEPFYSPSLARHCAHNYCMFASWGTQAHIPNPFKSSLMYITKFTNCGDGIIEHTQMIHNFADPLTSESLVVDQDYFNVGWSGVRSSNLPFALEPTNDVLTIGSAADVRDVDYLPLCRWNQDFRGGPAGRAEIKNLDTLGGYTTFVGEGLIVNREYQLTTACRKAGASCNLDVTGCMVESCTDADIADGYVRIPLGVRASSGPNCAFHNQANPHGGYVALKCDFRLTSGFGRTRPYTTGTDPCAPWKDARIGFYNTLTGAMLEVSFVRHWSFSASNFLVYFSTFIKDTGTTSQTEAIDMVNNMFAAGSSNFDIELRSVNMSPVKPWCRKPTGCLTGPSVSDPDCMVSSCTETMIENGYTRIALGVPPEGPDCQFYNTTDPYQGLVSLQCNLRTTTGFGFTDVNEDRPIRFYNTITGKMVEVAFVKHWSLYGDDRRVYFSVFRADDGVDGVNRNLAINEVNEIFANDFTSTIPIEIRSPSETGSDVSPSYDPAPLPAFTYVYGKGEEYDTSGGDVSGWSRRRIGSTVDTRDYTVFTINWLGTAKLRAGETYVNRGFKFSSDLGSVQATASNLNTKIYIDEIALEQWTPRKIDIYQDSSKVVAVAATSAGGDSTTCPALSSPVCSGKSTPQFGLDPFFHVECGSESYLGPNPYHFNPLDYCILVKTNSASASDGHVAVYVNANDGAGYIKVSQGQDDYYATNEVVVDQCYADLAGVKIQAVNSNAWVGTVKVSQDHKMTYSSLPCVDCGGENNAVGSIVVDNDFTDSSAAPTQCLQKTCTLPFRPFCVLVKTRGMAYSDGCMDVLIDSGNGYVPFSVPGAEHQKNDVVVDQCFSDLRSVQVFATTTNAWIGDIQVSTDGKLTYNALTCDNCSGTTSSASPIFVDGDGGSVSGVSTYCIDGKTCTLTYRHPPCLLVQTSNIRYSDGYVALYVDSGDGYVLASDPGRKYGRNEVVVDQCFADLRGVRVTNTNRDGWIGEIKGSIDGKATYSALACDDCGSPTSSASPIVVDGDNTAPSSVSTYCIDGTNGNACTLPFGPLCVLAQTSGMTHSDGYVGVYVDSGNGYVLVSDPSRKYAKNQVVVDRCYTNLLSVKVVNTNRNAWIGDIQVSKDYGATYSAMKCDNCSGTTASASPIFVDGDSGSMAGVSTYCIDGNSCILPLSMISPSYVRPYTCKDQGVSVRPSWKLMGFFDASDPGCAGLSTSTSAYDDSACGLFP
eukprot:CAMPEP_0196161200 /NCGR_PEP_ID=MMETSP0910-20130528/47215_1 /TAXON_ID=49265 /ORGANISM="Thalassiosira rotula, Strain GSO102" /LENGTH=1412 /DNA_ID=CAMNT_0041426141 /DNA_START=120 /DNA_END=4358 /DNA_ORIENTATION=+